MAYAFKDRVRDTTTTTGTGTINLDGSPPTGFRAFTAFTTGDTLTYCIDGGSEWEVGIGTYTDATPDTLSRTTIIASSNAGSAVNFSAGTKQVFATVSSRGFAGRQTIWVPAGAMTSRTTNGAASGTTELATNDVMLSSLDFDTTTEEGAGFWVAMPKNWNESTVTFEAMWTAASGSGGVAFGLAAYAFSNDDAMDTAVSGQQVVTDTLITANDMHITSESSAITIGGTPAEGDVVYFEVTREVANGSDTIAADVKLLGLKLYITTNAATDD